MKSETEQEARLWWMLQGIYWALAFVLSKIEKQERGLFKGTFQRIILASGLIIKAREGWLEWSKKKKLAGL